MATLNEKVTVTFYRVVQCGYFGYADASPQFGNFPALLAEVGHWAKGKQLADTRLDAPAGEGDSLPVYLSNFQQHAGDYMATVWNEVPANKDGSVASAPANAPVGRVHQINNKVVPGTIPGFPTFFWLLSQDGLLATVRVESQTVTAQDAFRAYLERFMASQSVHAVRLPPAAEADDGDITVWGYRGSATHPVTTRVAPRFRTRLHVSPGAIEEIVRRVAEIRTVHRRTQLLREESAAQAAWQKVMRIPREIITAQANLRVSMATTLTAPELKTLIADWRKRGHGMHADDYGFQFKGESGIHWLSGARASTGAVVPVTREDANQQVDTGALLEVLMHRKQELLAVVR